MAETGQSVIDRARARLLSGSEQLNVLASNYTAGSGSVVFADSVDQVMGQGTRFSIGQVVFQVRSLNAATKTATVFAGVEGSTDANITAPAVVRINPRFTDFALFTELNFDLADLSGQGLFQVKLHEFTYLTDAESFDLTTVTGMIEPYAVRQRQPGTTKRWAYLEKGLDWRLERNANVAMFPSGLALRILNLNAAHHGETMQFLYKAGLSSLSAPTGLMSDTGLPSSASDLPELGITYRLLPQRDAKRNFTETQPNPRRTEQVPPGSILRTAAVLRQVRDERIRTELARLRASYPDRKR